MTVVSSLNETSRTINANGNTQPRQAKAKAKAAPRRGERRAPLGPTLLAPSRAQPSEANSLASPPVLCAGARADGRFASAS